MIAMNGTSASAPRTAIRVTGSGSWTFIAAGELGDSHAQPALDFDDFAGPDPPAVDGYAHRAARLARQVDHLPGHQRLQLGKREFDVAEVEHDPERQLLDRGGRHH